MIIPVILAGGVGSRLWPLSRKAFPKQFISFLPGADSLFQETLTRLNGLLGVSQQPVIVCNQEHRFMVAEQLRAIGIDEACILLEPVGRNTAPAVALAALETKTKDENDILLVLAADHLIKKVENFHTAIREGEQQAKNGKLVTFGVVPDSPETGYGYIHRGKAMNQAYAVDSFVEKPDLETARAYVASGEYYWNSGMFMFSASSYLNELGNCNPDMLRIAGEAFAARDDDLDFKRIPEDIFARCPDESIDYAVMEKTRDAVVIPLDAGWSDLGAWSALWEQGSQDQSGNVVVGDVLLHDVRNSFIHASSRLVSLVGMEDAVVIETSDAVLVSARGSVQDVREIVERLKSSQRNEAESHSLVYRPWGSYESLVEDKGFKVKRIIVNPHASLSLQMHHHRAEHWTVVQGSAQVSNGEKVFMLNENESTFIPVETRHRLENLSDEPVVLIEVQCGSYLGEDDIVRFEDIYGRKM